MRTTPIGLTDEQRALGAGGAETCQEYPGEHRRDPDAAREYREAFVGELTRAGYLAAPIPQACGEPIAAARALPALGLRVAPTVAHPRVGARSGQVLTADKRPVSLWPPPRPGHLPITLIFLRILVSAPSLQWDSTTDALARRSERRNQTERSH
jgi:hypothetical protein